MSDLGLEYWLLDEEHKAVRCTMMEWAEFFEDTGKRIVEQTDIPCEGAMQSRPIPNRKPGTLPMHEKVVTNTVRVSTVFLGLDHSWGSSGPPILFETMIFGGEHDEYQDRCALWDQALKMHKRAVWIARGADEDQISGGAA